MFTIETNFIEASKNIPARTIISNKLTSASPARSSKKTRCSDLNALSTTVLESSIALSIRSSWEGFLRFQDDFLSIISYCHLIEF